MLRLRGDWSFGHIGCGAAVLVHAVAMALLLGLSLLSIVVPGWLAPVLIVGGVVVVLALSTPAEYFRRHGPIVRQVELELDDGGLRVTIGSSCRYIPLRDLSVELVPATDPRDIVVPGPLFRMTVGLAAADRSRAAAFVAEVARRRAQLAPTPPELMPLCREGAPLAVWAARVLAHVESERRGGGYRGAVDLDDARLLSIAADPAVEPDVRAAAGYALLRLAPAHAADAVRAIDAGAPPIAVAMFYAGAGESLRSAYAVVADFLARADRRAAPRLAGVTSRSSTPA